MPQGTPLHLIVTPDEAETLCIAIEEALKPLDYAHLSSIYPTRRRKPHHGIPVSFDADWRAFLVYTVGLNRDKDEREYLRAGSAILTVIRDYLREKHKWGPEGGRAFLSREGVRFDSETLMSWDWNAECPIARLTRFRDSLKSERQTTAQKACLDGLQTAWKREDEGDLAAAEFHRKKARESLVNVNLEGDFDNLKRLEDAITVPLENSPSRTSNRSESSQRGSSN